MRGADCQTDHELLVSFMSFKLKKKERRTRKVAKIKLNTGALRDHGKQLELQTAMDPTMNELLQTRKPTLEEEWSNLRDTMIETSKRVLGYERRKEADWFAQNIDKIEPLIQAKSLARNAYLNRKTRSTMERWKESVSRMRAMTRILKSEWIERKAHEIQHCADAHDARGFFQLTSEVYGPRRKGFSSLLAKDGSLITDQGKVLERWKEHFEELLNRPSNVSANSMASLIQRPTVNSAGVSPTLLEIEKAVQALPNGKAPGEDGLPPEVFKHGGYGVIRNLHKLFVRIWEEESVPQQLKNASIVSIYKNKGSRSDCDNHRGISLLVVAGKVLAKVIQRRLVENFLDTVSESQCGFRAARGTMDMVFTARQLQEKCIEHQVGLYAVFIDLTKAFDTVNREALWTILLRLGCPGNLVRVIRQLHDGMTAQVCADGNTSQSFAVITGVKQGCVIAPILFVLFFAAMLEEALKDNDDGIYVKVRKDGGLFNLARLKAKTKVYELLVRDLLFADDCGLFAHTEEALQRLMDSFASAAKNFGLKISVRKTEVMHQPAPELPRLEPFITLEGETLKTTEAFTYLGSVLTADGQIDKDIDNRISKASQAFGRLKKRIWTSHNIRLSAKITLYRAMVLTTLIYGCEAWTLYSRHIRKLNQFHQRCMRTILGVKWDDMVTNDIICERTGLPEMAIILKNRQLRWLGHVERMPSGRLPKEVLYSELATGTRKRGRPRLRYKDTAKETLKSCGVAEDWEMKAMNRETWKSTVWQGVERLRVERVEQRRQKRLRRKDPDAADLTGFECDICGRPCKGRAGLVAHKRVHVER